MAYKYEIIADKLRQTGVGNAVQKPEIVVVHHSGVLTEKPYNIINRLNSYAVRHMQKIGNKGLAYHFYIPRDESEMIYITRYFNQAQYHCANRYFNARSIAVLVEGNFKEQDPTSTQLKKLQQLLDELPRLFNNAVLSGLDPKDNTTVRRGEGITLKGGVFGHKEVAEVKHPTVCPARLLNYVQQYRNNKGNVLWGDSILSPSIITPLEAVQVVDVKEVIQAKEVIENKEKIFMSEEQVNILKAEHSSELAKKISEIETLKSQMGSKNTELNEFRKQSEDAFLKKDSEHRTIVETLKIERNKLKDELRKFTEEDVLEDGNYVNKELALRREIEEKDKEIARLLEEIKEEKQFANLGHEMQIFLKNNPYIKELAKDPSQIKPSHFKAPLMFALERFRKQSKSHDYLFKGLVVLFGSGIASILWMILKPYTNDSLSTSVSLETLGGMMTAVIGSIFFGLKKGAKQNSMAVLALQLLVPAGIDIYKAHKLAKQEEGDTVNIGLGTAQQSV